LLNYFDYLCTIMAINKKWIVKEQGNPAIVRQLAQEVGIDQILANLLVQRGIDTFAKAREFFRPDLSMLRSFLDEGYGQGGRSS